MTPAGSSTAPSPEREPVPDRVPPHSLDAERAVLAAMMMETDAIMRASELLDDTMFYQEGHRRLYRAIVAIVERDAVVDAITLGDELERRDELKASGGKEYIAELMDYIPTAANIEYHARIVKEKAIRRRLGELAAWIEREARTDKGGLPVDELLDQAETEMLGLSQTRNAAAPTLIGPIARDILRTIKDRNLRGESLSGVASGFRDLDNYTTGFRPGDLVVIGARPAMGKTALALNMAAFIAGRSQLPVAFFSIEMTKEQLAQRMIISTAMVDAQRVRQAQLNEDEIRQLESATELVAEYPLSIFDASNTTVLDIRGKSRRLRAESGLAAVFVDYLQLMAAPPGDTREQEIAAISRGLKRLAKELGVPVIALSQLNRAVETRMDKRPQLSDLRESGAIEQDADLVLFLYRREVHEGPKDKDGKSLEGQAELIISKQREGPIGSIDLVFHKNCTRFDGLSLRTALDDRQFGRQTGADIRRYGRDDD